MNIRTRFTFNRLATASMLLFFLTLAGGLRAQDQGAPQDQNPQQDPPDRIARLSFLQGSVSLQPASPNGDAAFAAAEVNYTLSAGDRLYNGPDGLSELQSDNLALRLASASDVTLVNFSQDFVQLGLAQGSLRVRTYQIPANTGVEVDTANGSFTILRAGDVRISSYPGYGQRPDTTIVTVNAGQVHALGNGLDTLIESGQALRIDGDTPVQSTFVELLPSDELDQFDQQRDEQRAAAAGEIRDQYVNPGMVGYDDLTQYGDWTPSPDYGQVWYPRAVDVGWSPYHNGHWAYIAPWGYTWVEAEPWGFAPFHYGRWAQFNGRWGWVAGPPVVRPIYSPALVAFVGGPGFSLSIRTGGGGGVAAWFPLGPREPFVPWYRASPGYVNRVNVSNIYNRNTVEVRNVYVNRTTNVYINNNITYVNRDRGTVAVPQQAFARGQQVRAAQVAVDPRQMQQAQVMTRPPEVTGRPGPTVGLAPARALPPVQARPQFQQRQFPAQSGTVTGPTQVRTPGGIRAPEVNAGQPQNQPRTNQPVPQTQPGRELANPDITTPVGGARNNRPAQPLETRPIPTQQSQPVIPQPPTQVRTPGGLRAPNPGNNPDLPQTPQRPTPQSYQPQPSRTPPTQDITSPVGSGRNNRPADQFTPRPTTPTPPPVPPTRPQQQPRPEQRPIPQQQPKPAPQQNRPAPKPEERKPDPK